VSNIFILKSSKITGHLCCYVR